MMIQLFLLLKHILTKQFDFTKSELLYFLLFECLKINGHKKSKNILAASYNIGLLL